MKVLPVSVFRDARLPGDYTNGGVSAARDELFLVGPFGWKDVPDNDPRLIRVVERKNFAARPPYLSAVPVNPDRGDKVIGPMFGGNFIYSCDSRFPSDYPIPVHDRYETQEQYDLLFD